MAGEFVFTMGDAAQIPDIFKGDFLKGHREPRIAMVGRSNVGKSSLINSILGTRLAQVSKEPGKTRKIHFYLWKEAGRIIADLPGYGYARAGHEERERWAVFIRSYFEADPALRLAVVLLDSRHGPTELDIEALRFLSEQRVAIQIVFTKSDALKTQSERALRKNETSKSLKELGLDPASAVWVSSLSKDGMKKLASVLQGEGAA